MNWDSYYRARSQRRAPSPFALWSEPLFPPRATVIDLGAGDGRDASYFADRGHRVTAVDASVMGLRLAAGVRKLRADVAELEDVAEPYEVAYMRWLLHAVTPAVQRSVLEWCARNARLVFIEARSDQGEHPDDHYRRPLRLTELLAELHANGYHVTRAHEGADMSRDGDDNPILMRVVAALSSKNAVVLIPSDQRGKKVMRA